MADPPAAEPKPSRLDWARWIAALALVIVGFVAAATRTVETCSEEITDTGAVVETCKTPTVSDAVTIAWAASILALMAPDLAEASVGGLFVLKRRLAAQQEEIKALGAQITSIRASFSQSAQAVVNVYGDTPVAPSEPVPAVDDELVAQANAAAAQLLVDAIRTRLPGPLAGGRLHIYLPDRAGQLTPVLEPLGSPSATDRWRPGQGVVGEAWTAGDVVTALGAEVTAGLDDLPADRLARYRATTAVIAAPLLNARGRRIGVVSVSTERADSTFDAQAAADALFEVAEPLARMVIDLLGWESDAGTSSRPLPGGNLPS